MIKRLILFTFLSVSTLHVQAQSQAFRSVFDRLSGANKFFFYPSTLRALSGGNEQFLDFVKDIKNLKLVMLAPEDEFFEKLKINEFRQEIKKEGFVELMTIKEGKSLVTVMEDDDTTLALMNSKDKVALVELVGKVNIAAGMKMLREGELPVQQFENFFKKDKKEETSRKEPKDQ